VGVAFGVVDAIEHDVLDQKAFARLQAGDHAVEVFAELLNV
jgi:hypothetical protein